MTSLLLLDEGLSCFVCLVQVITDRARAVEGKFFLSFHLPPPPFPQNQKYRLPLLRLVSLGVLRMIYEVCIKDSYTLR